MKFKQPYKKADDLVPAFNVGAGMDIITGAWYRGQHDEHLLNGGLAMLSGYVGDGNLYKTTTMLFKILTAMARAEGSSGSMFETEMNTQPRRVKDLADQVEDFHGEDIIKSERFVVSNRKHYSGDEWYEETKTWLEEKTLLGKKKDFIAKTPFVKLHTNELLEMIYPTFGALDSFSDFVTKDVTKMNDDVELGGKGAETMFLKQGIQKLRLLTEFPPLLHKASHYFCMSAQMGPIFNMDQYNPEKKKLSAIQGNKKMKGVTDKFTYIMNSILQFYNLEKLLTKDKTPQFPRDEYDSEKNDSDLNVLHATELRGKGGPSGIPIRLVVSQKQGVLASMTEFYNLWSHPDSFGLEGNNVNYNLALCPDVKLSRMKVRQRIDESAMLRRALTITMELMQMWRFMPEYRTAGILCTPEVLFQDLKEKGYDWDWILGGTRGWWTYNNDEHPVPYLSTMDLLMMRLDKYKPYRM